MTTRFGFALGLINNLESHLWCDFPRVQAFDQLIHLALSISHNILQQLIQLFIVFPGMNGQSCGLALPFVPFECILSRLGFSDFLCSCLFLQLSKPFAFLDLARQNAAQLQQFPGQTD